MPKFDVDDDVAELVAHLAHKGPFEQLSFNDALKRVLSQLVAGQGAGNGARSPHPRVAPSRIEPLKKAPSPSATEWAASVPELRTRRGLSTWKAICDVLEIDPAGDSARRKLKAWVSLHRPTWPAVPEV